MDASAWPDNQWINPPTGLPQAGPGGLSPAYSPSAPNNGLTAFGWPAMQAAPLDDIDSAARQALGDQNWTILSRLLGPQPAAMIPPAVPQTTGDQKIDGLVAALQARGEGGGGATNAPIQGSGSPSQQDGTGGGSAIANPLSTGGGPTRSSPGGQADPLNLRASINQETPQDSINWFNSHGPDVGPVQYDSHDAAIQASPTALQQAWNTAANNWSRGRQDASARLDRDFFADNWQSQAVDALDPLTFRNFRDIVGLLAEPSFQVVSGLVRPLFPNEHDAVAEQAAAENNRIHWSLLDPNHVLTPNKKSDLTAQILLSLPLERVPFDPAATLPDEEIPTIGGRPPINSRLAGQTHPSGVQFDQRGFPNFDPYAIRKFRSGDLTGDYRADAAMANKTLGFPRTPNNFVWHHVQDGRTLLLIPRDIHEATGHTGGVAVIQNGGLDQ